MESRLHHRCCCKKLAPGSRRARAGREQSRTSVEDRLEHPKCSRTRFGRSSSRRAPIEKGARRACADCLRRSSARAELAPTRNDSQSRPMARAQRLRRSSARAKSKTGLRRFQEEPLRSSLDISNGVGSVQIDVYDETESIFKCINRWLYA
jgi:hypothetical protein